MRLKKKKLHRAETSVTVFPCKKNYLRYEIFIAPTKVSRHAGLEIVKSTISFLCKKKFWLHQSKVLEPTEPPPCWQHSRAQSNYLDLSPEGHWWVFGLLFPRPASVPLWVSRWMIATWRNKTEQHGHFLITQWFHAALHTEPNTPHSIPLGLLGWRTVFLLMLMLSFVRVRGWMPTGQRDTTGWWTESTETGTGSHRLIGNPSLSTNTAARYPLTLRTHVWMRWLGTFIILLNPVSCFFPPDYVCLMSAKQIHF